MRGGGPGWEVTEGSGMSEGRGRGVTVVGAEAMAEQNRQMLFLVHLTACFPFGGLLMWPKEQ